MNPQQIINKMNQCLMAMQKGNVEYKSLGLRYNEKELDILRSQLAWAKVEYQNS